MAIVSPQPATTAPAVRARPARELRAYPAPKLGWAVVKITGLVMLAAAGAIALAGAVGLGLLMVLVHVGG